MLTLTQKLTESRPPDAELTLPFQSRSKSRLRAALPSGEEAALILERGSVLRDGDLLLGDDGRVVRIVAAAETVSTVRCDEVLALTRTAYHLGNRHVALQIGPGWLRYQHDHVLDEMVRGLGLAVLVEEAPFEPEAGAYGGHTALAPHTRAHPHSHG